MNYFKNPRPKYGKLQQIAENPDPALLRTLLEDQLVDPNYIFEDQHLSSAEETSDVNIFQLFCTKYIFSKTLTDSSIKLYEQCIDVILNGKLDIRYRDTKWKLQALDFAALTGNVNILNRTLEEYDNRGILYANSSVLVNLLDFIYEEEHKEFMDEEDKEKNKKKVAEKEESFDILLNKGIDVNLISVDGEIAVYVASYLYNTTFLKNLLDKCKNQIDFQSRRNPVGRTMEDFIDIRDIPIEIRELYINLNENDSTELKKNLDDMTYKQGKRISREELWSLLLCSVEYGKKDIFNMLFDEYNIKFPCEAVEQTNKQTNILLEKCCLNGDDVILSNLLDLADIQIYNYIIWDLVISSDSRITDKTSNMRYCKCLAILLDYLKENSEDFDINKVDCYGNTLLHYAAKNKYGDMTQELLKHGASLVGHNNQDSLVLQMSKADVEQYLDSCVGYFDLREKKQNNNNSKTKGSKNKNEKGIYSVDLTSLLPPRQVKNKEQSSKVLIDPEAKGKIEEEANIQQSEMTVMEQLCKDSEYKTLLVHPVIELFCYLKWYRIRLFFFLDLLVYFLFLLSHVFHVLSTMYNTVTGSYTILFTTFMGFLVWEFVQILIFRLEYFKALENYMKLALIGITLGILVIDDPNQDLSILTRSHTTVEMLANLTKIITTTTITTTTINTSTNLTNCNSTECKEYVTEIQVYAVDAVISIVNLFFLTANIPRLSNNVLMIKSVYRNLCKFFLTYSILIFGFAASFYVLFKDFKGFENPAIALFKTLIMLTGEYDSSNLNDGFSGFPQVSYAIFAIFIILMSIGMLNLLTGLAVSDIQRLKHDAKMLYLMMRINQIVKMEKILLNYFFCFNFICLFFKNDENKEIIINPSNRIVKIKSRNSMTLTKNQLRDLDNCRQRNRMRDLN